MERVYPDRVNMLPEYGPMVSSLKAFLESTLPTKNKAFLMADGLTMYSGQEICDQEEFKVIYFASIVGAPEESINHVFFEFSPAIQVWELSRIPSNPYIFPTKSLFANMYLLFWRVSQAKESSSLCIDLMVHLERKKQQKF